MISQDKDSTTSYLYTKCKEISVTTLFTARVLRANCDSEQSIVMRILTNSCCSSPIPSHIPSRSAHPLMLFNNLGQITLLLNIGIIFLFSLNCGINIDFHAI